MRCSIRPPCLRQIVTIAILYPAILIAHALAFGVEPGNVSNSNVPRAIAAPARELVLNSDTCAHQGEVYGAAFTPDESKLITHGADSRLKIWDSATGSLLRSVGGLAGATPQFGTQIEWSTTSQRIALVSSGALFVFSYPELKQLLKTEVGIARSARFLADDKYIAVQQSDRIELRDSSTGAIRETIPTLPQPHSDALSAVYSSKLAYCDVDGLPMIRDFGANHVRQLPKPKGDVFALYFVDSGKRLVVTGTDHRMMRQISFLTPPTPVHMFVNVFDIEKSEPVQHFGPDLKRVGSGNTIAAISPNDRLVVLARIDCAQVFDVPNDRYLAGLPGFPARRYVFGEKGKFLAIQYPNVVEVWSTDTWSPAFDRRGHPMKPESAAASRDGSFVATSTRDGVRLWNGRTGEQLWYTDHHELERLLPKPSALLGPSSNWWLGLKSMCFSADNRNLFGIEGRDGCRVLALDTATGKVQRVVWTTPVREGSLLFRPEALRFTPTCDRMLVRGREFYLVDTQEGNVLWTNGPRKGVDRSWMSHFPDAFSPNGKLLARISASRTLTVLDLDRGRELFGCELNLSGDTNGLPGVLDLQFVTSNLVVAYAGPLKGGLRCRFLLVDVIAGQPCGEFTVPFGRELGPARYGRPFWVSGRGYGSTFEFSLLRGSVVAETGSNGDPLDHTPFVGNHGCLFTRYESALIGQLPPVVETGLNPPLEIAALDACWKELAGDAPTAWKSQVRLANCDGNWPEQLAGRIGQESSGERSAMRLIMALGMSPNRVAGAVLKRIADRNDGSSLALYAAELRKEERAGP